jgi:hypothetical protein
MVFKFSDFPSSEKDVVNAWQCYRLVVGQNSLSSYWSEQQAYASHWLEGFQFLRKHISSFAVRHKTPTASKSIFVTPVWSRHIPI